LNPTNPPPLRPSEYRHYLQIEASTPRRVRSHLERVHFSPLLNFRASLSTTITSPPHSIISHSPVSHTQVQSQPNVLLPLDACDAPHPDLAEYLAFPTINAKESGISWWNKHKQRFPPTC
jgi:hypothetical protein